MNTRVRMGRRISSVVVAVSLLCACGDDAGGGTSASTQGADDGTSASTTPDVTTCAEANTVDECANAGGGGCRWLTSYFLPGDGASCALDQPHGGACVDYTTSDGCNVGPCGPPSDFGGTFELFYRIVDGGFEVVRAEDCNPTLEGFSACPFDPPPDSPFFCDCLCTPGDGSSSTG